MQAFTKLRMLLKGLFGPMADRFKFLFLSNPLSWEHLLFPVAPDSAPKIGNRFVNREGRLFTVVELLKNDAFVVQSEDRKKITIAKISSSDLYHTSEESVSCPLPDPYPTPHF